MSGPHDNDDLNDKIIEERYERASTEFEEIKAISQQSSDKILKDIEYNKMKHDLENFNIVLANKTNALNSLQEDYDHIKSSNTKLENDYNDAIQQNEKLTANLKDIKKEFDELKIQNNHLKKQIQNNTVTITKNNEEIQKLENKLSQKDDIIEDIQKTLEIYEKQIKNDINQINLLKTYIKEKEEDKDNIDLNIKDILDNEIIFESKIPSTDVSGTSPIQTKKDKVERIGQDIDKIQNDISLKSELIKNIKESLESASEVEKIGKEQDLEIEKNNYDLLQQKLIDRQNRLEKLSKDIEEKNKSSRELQKQQQQLKEEEEEEGEDNDEIVEQYNDLSKYSNDIVTVLAECNKVIESLKIKNEDREEDDENDGNIELITQLEKSLKYTNNKIKILSVKVQESEKRFNEIQEELNKKKIGYKDLENKNIQIKEKQNEYKNNISDLEKELKEINDKYEENNKQLSDIQTRYNMLKIEHSKLETQFKEFSKVSGDASIDMKDKYNQLVDECLDLRVYIIIIFLFLFVFLHYYYYYRNKYSHN